MDDESFVLADMTVELHKFEHGAVIGFNGTTEWALDSVDPRDSVWLPSEGQLRELLAQTFVALERDGERWRVRYVAGPSERSVTHEDAAQAYGLALLYLVTGEDVAA